MLSSNLEKMAILSFREIEIEYMRVFVLCLLLLLQISEADSVPAYPRQVVFRLEEGSQVLIKLQGDEYNKWALTTDN